MNKERIISKLEQGLEITLQEAGIILSEDSDFFKIHEAHSEDKKIKYLVSTENYFRYQGQNSFIHLIDDKIIKCLGYKTSLFCLKNGFKIQNYFRSKNLSVPKSEGLFLTIKKRTSRTKEISFSFQFSHSMEYIDYPRFTNATKSMTLKEYVYACDKIREYSEEMRDLGYLSEYSSSRWENESIHGLKMDNILWNPFKKEPTFIDFDHDTIKNNPEFDSFDPKPFLMR